MSDAQAVGGFDRLPWLADEISARRAPRRDLAGWAAAAVVLVAGMSFWLGIRTPADQSPVQPAHIGPSTIVAVPAPRPAPQQEVRLAPQPEIESVRIPEVQRPVDTEVRIAPPPLRTVAPPEAVRGTAKLPAPAAKAPAAKTAPAAALTPWPSRVTAGANGRLVQIGAYGSRLQAKRGWVSMVHAYPAVAHLSAVVVGARNSRGRSFYRFQIGTTSQAHSEVLCQRMEKIDLSCAVVGLPWKAKVER